MKTDDLTVRERAAIDAFLSAVDPSESHNTAPEQEIADYTIAELIVAYIMLPADIEHAAHRLAAGRILRARAELESDETMIIAVTDLAARDRDAAENNANVDALCATRRWANATKTNAVCMRLSVARYDWLISAGTSYQWGQYIADQLRASSTLTKQQRDLASTLARNWQGTGSSLVDTASELCPA
jgi:hypothetical protein